MKRCIECGCNMPDNHDGNMCEICVEERDGTVPEFLRKELSIGAKSAEFIFGNRSIRESSRAT